MADVNRGTRRRRRRGTKGPSARAIERANANASFKRTGTPTRRKRTAGLLGPPTAGPTPRPTRTEATPVTQGVRERAGLLGPPTAGPPSSAPKPIGVASATYGTAGTRTAPKAGLLGPPTAGPRPSARALERASSNARFKRGTATPITPKLKPRRRPKKT